MNPVDKILGNNVRKYKDISKNNSVQQKVNWNEYIKKIEQNGYTIIWRGRCPNCGGKAVQIHNDGVIHSKCENDDFHNTGFGGPNVRSWAAAVAHDSNITSQEQIENERRQQKEELRLKHNEAKMWLLNNYPKDW